MGLPGGNLPVGFLRRAIRIGRKEWGRFFVVQASRLPFPEAGGTPAPQGSRGWRVGFFVVQASRLPFPEAGGTPAPQGSRGWRVGFFVVQASRLPFPEAGGTPAPQGSRGWRTREE